jgi:soluble lytic murein transglycosylase
MSHWHQDILKHPALNSPTKLAVAGGMIVTLLGAGIYSWQSFSSPDVPVALTETLPGAPDGGVAPLSSQRRQELTAQANSSKPKARQQARVALAVDALEQRQATAALKWLEGLERDYPVLSAQILGWRAEAQALAGKPQAAIATWEAVLKQFPDQPEAANALYGLGKLQPQRQAEHWDQVIQRFPQHPRAVDIAQARLKQNPNQPQLLVLLAKHGLYLENIKSILETLTTKYAAQLTPADWEAVGFAYWEKLDYGNAAKAYARAPKTALNQFRAARGLHLVGQRPAATAAYRQFVQAFADAPETPIAYIRLAQLTDPATALGYLDQAIQTARAQKLNERVAEALAAKITLLEKSRNNAAAAKVRQELFRNYGHTEAAATQRWLLAQKQAQNNQWAAARRLALELAKESPKSSLAPRALFWAGRWANRLGKPQEQTQTFTQLWQRYPESYYTWRAASLSNWSVGNFTSVQSFQPKIRPENLQRLPLMAGSPVLKELYQIGVARPAWERWQWEFRNRVKPTTSEQFTDGLMRLGIGEYLDGIFMLENLWYRAQQEPEFQAQYQQLRQQPGYWYALYPLPYLESTQRWSKQNNLNPLLALGLMRQESRFQSKIRSAVGAVGLMQVMPETGTWISEQTGVKQYSLENIEDNIRFGTWYLDYTHDLYQGNTSYALASYNAGPGNLDGWLKRFPTQDPDLFIESIPFDETQNYVKKVMENYWNYLRLYNPETIEQLRQYQAKSRTTPK